MTTIKGATYEADNGQAITAEEHLAIQALHRLAKRWPQTLTLLSYDGALSVVHTVDRGAIADGWDPERQALILAEVYGIPNDGGGW